MKSVFSGFDYCLKLPSHFADLAFVFEYVFVFCRFWLSPDFICTFPFCWPDNFPMEATSAWASLFLQWIFCSQFTDWTDECNPSENSLRKNLYSKWNGTYLEWNGFQFKFHSQPNLTFVIFLHAHNFVLICPHTKAHKMRQNRFCNKTM